ncbi:hypothetical protein HYQ46_002227 [Verticillium longisporum]|nr:hypothetical protein HYQ46_002227 [Verticillium longisporum]
MHTHRDLETVDRSLLYFQRFCKRLNEDCVPAAREALPPTDEARLSISIPNGNGIGDDVSESRRIPWCYTLCLASRGQGAGNLSSLA